MKKVFFDTEFTGLHKNTTLISIGIIFDTGETLYAELTDYDETQIDEWLNNNVIKNLKLQNMENNTIKYENDMQTKYIKGHKKFVSNEINCWIEFINRKHYYYKKIEFWSDCLAYDLVLLNDLLADYKNGYPELPKYIYYIPFDICTLFKIKGIDPDINREEFAKNGKNFWFTEEEKHNSLFDAKIIKMCYDKLMKINNRLF